jgi:deazaflavin-dependent oxidoreductase (nitroreductase family)
VRASRFWQAFGHLHTWLYEATGGRVGARGGGRDMLLLTTTGRRSGEPRTLPLAYLRDGDAFVIVASNGGASRHPAWYHNLRAHPTARVRAGRQVFEAAAVDADAAERARLWPLLTEYNPPYARYAERTEREIPVAVLRRR